MLHVFYGNDTVTVRETAQAFVEAQLAPGGSTERLDSETYQPGALADMAGATSLFGEQTIYLIDTPSLQRDLYDDVIEHLPALAESPNTFVLIEQALLAPEKKKFAKHAASIEEHKQAAPTRYNVFGMADSLAKKDKRTLWVQLQEARHAGLVPEEIIGTLWWQLKSLRAAAATRSAAEAGMKDFPYSKAKRSLSNFGPGELEQLSTRLLTLYHDGHGGKVDIDLALEKWVLTI